jgi:vacuolar-type H+-ATPase subunit H
MSKKLVKITENDLVELIDNIVTEAVAEKKKVWLAEQKEANKKSDALLENRIAKLETLLKNAKVTKTVTK